MTTHVDGLRWMCVLTTSPSPTAGNFPRTEPITMNRTGTYAHYQNTIYENGVRGVKPSLPVKIEDLEALARETISPEAYHYIAGGAGSESTMRFNLQAFERWRIVPRMLRDVSQRDLSVDLLGTTLPVPVLLAPIGVQTIAHPEGDLAVARAASSLGVPMIYSTAATFTPEEVAAAAGDGPRWYQLYWPRDREVTRSFLQRAEVAGYTVLVVTLDTRVLAWRERDLATGYLPMLKGEGIGFYLSDPAFRSTLAVPPEDDPQAAIKAWAEGFADLSQTWDDIAYLRDCTSMPIVLKGILHPDDAVTAVRIGVDGIIVSNHGGRQMDGAIAALDALPPVVDAVGGQIPVLFDSGIRRGADILKALALGARAVLLGRPYMWGLATGGEEGVRDVLNRLFADFDLTMALSGHKNIRELSRSALQLVPGQFL